MGRRASWPVRPAPTVPSGGISALAEEHTALLADLEAPLRDAAAQAATLADPTELALWAGALIPPELSDTPGVGDRAVALLARQAHARPLLAAMAAAALPPLADAAATAEARLAAAGAPTSDAARRLRACVVTRAWWVAGGRPPALVVALAHGNTPEQERVAITLDPDGEGLRDALVLPAGCGPSAAELLAWQCEEGGTPRRITSDEAAERLAAAARRNVGAGLGPTLDALLALTRILRAASGRRCEPVLTSLARLPALPFDATRRRAA